MANKTTKMNFEDYLKTRRNTLIREDVLNQKLIFDLKEAGARNFFHLKIFKADVDINGFDIMIDDDDQMMIKCQIKSRFNATTPTFPIHKIMLRPSHYIVGKLGFDYSVCPPDNRGVILIDGYIENDNIAVKYSYLDCFLLRAMALGIFKLNRESKNSAKKLINSVNNGSSNQKINVLQSLFFPVKDAQSLLSLMGNSPTMSISDKILKISEAKKTQNNLYMDLAKLFPIKNMEKLLLCLKYIDSNSISENILNVSVEKQKSQKEIDMNLVKTYWNEVNEDLEKIIDSNRQFTKNSFPTDF